jgi:hypothetical protein
MSANLFDNLFTPVAGFLGADVHRRAACLGLASKSLAARDANVYDLVAVADYLDRGHEAMDEAPACSCNNPEGEHPRGDSAFCSMAAE